MTAPPSDDVRSRETLDRYLHDIGAYALLSREEEILLGRRAAAGDGEAVDALVLANLRFVVNVAKKYKHHGVPLMDLVAEGNLGLLRAARRFDPDQGVRFISYAVWWIRQAIHHALAEQSRIVRVPQSRAAEFRRVGRWAAALEQQLGREPTPAEVADAAGLAPADAAVLLWDARAHVSLDAAPGPEGDGALVERLADDRAPAPDAPLLEGARAAAIAGSLRRLKEREARVLRLYFGLDGGEPLTLDEIGVLLGVTRERVRQIKETALARLRHASQSHSLAAYR